MTHLEVAVLRGDHDARVELVVHHGEVQVRRAHVHVALGQDRLVAAREVLHQVGQLGMLDRVALPVTTDDGPAKRIRTRCEATGLRLWALGIARDVRRVATHFRGMVARLLSEESTEGDSVVSQLERVLGGFVCFGGE